MYVMVSAYRHGQPTLQLPADRRTGPDPLAGRRARRLLRGPERRAFPRDRPSTSIFEGTSALVPDPLNHGWRDYGVRVAIWRLMESLDRHGVRASVLLNSEVCERYPQIVEAGLARDWAWIAHG